MHPHPQICRFMKHQTVKHFCWYIYIPVWWGYMFLILSEMHIYTIYMYINSLWQFKMFPCLFTCKTLLLVHVPPCTHRFKFQKVVFDSGTHWTIWWVVNYGHQKYTYLEYLYTWSDLSDILLAFLMISIFLKFFWQVKYQHCYKKSQENVRNFRLWNTVPCLFLTLTVFCDKAIKLFRAVWSYCSRFLFYWYMWCLKMIKKKLSLIAIFHWIVKYIQYVLC